MRYRFTKESHHFSWRVFPNYFEWHISSLLQGSEILLTLTEGVCSFVMLQSSMSVHCWVKTHRGFSVICSSDCPTWSRNESKNSEHWTVPPTANGNTGINTSIARMNLLLSKYSSLPVSTSLPPAVLNHVYIFISILSLQNE